MVSNLTPSPNNGGDQISGIILPQDWRSHPSSLLGKACYDGELEIVRYILTVITEGPELDGIKESFSTDVLWACTRGFPDIVACLLEHGAPITDCATYTASIENTQIAIPIYDILFKYGLKLADYPGIVQYVPHV